MLPNKIQTDIKQDNKTNKSNKSKIKEQDNIQNLKKNSITKNPN